MAMQHVNFVHQDPTDLPRSRNQESKMSIIVEIRAAEGGDDSKLLVEDQLGIYLKAASREHL